MTDDLISRQAAIDLFPNDVLEWDTFDGYIAPHEARRLIEDLPSAQPTYTDAEIQKMQDLEQAQIEKAYQLGREDAQSQWIPVSERLPDETGTYLVTVGNHAYPVEEAVFFAKDSYWAYVYTGSRYRDGYILAWMPLPEPYKEEE